MSGPPGTTFVQWGTGFTPNSTAKFHVKKPDGTEYDPWDQAIDSIGHFEVSYTAPWNKTPGTYTWWLIDGPTSQKSNEVSYLIEGKLGELHHFDITRDGINQILNQKPKVPFPIRIQARDYAGNLVTAFNGEVSLSLVGPGLISPNKITLVSGDGSNNVSISEPSVYIKIHGQSGVIVGDSNLFTVDMSFPVFGNVNGCVVKSSSGEAVEGATVKLGKSPFMDVERSTMQTVQDAMQLVLCGPGQILCLGNPGRPGQHHPLGGRERQ